MLHKCLWVVLLFLVQLDLDSSEAGACVSRCLRKDDQLVDVDVLEGDDFERLKHELLIQVISVGIVRYDTSLSMVLRCEKTLDGSESEFVVELNPLSLLLRAVLASCSSSLLLYHYLQEKLLEASFGELWLLPV